jgi:hypothetical protein
MDDPVRIHWEPPTAGHSAGSQERLIGGRSIPGVQAPAARSLQVWHHRHGCVQVTSEDPRKRHTIPAPRATRTDRAYRVRAATALGHAMPVTGRGSPGLAEPEWSSGETGPITLCRNMPVWQQVRRYFWGSRPEMNRHQQGLGGAARRRQGARIGSFGEGKVRSQGPSVVKPAQR